MDHLRAQRGHATPAWPPWCFLPLAGTVALLTRGAPEPDLRPLGLAIGMVSALAAWRVTQGIYRFDPDVFQAVWDTPLAGELPTALLSHLPEWCCYVPVEPPRDLWPGLPPLHGFFVHLEWDANTHHTELRFVLDTETSAGPWLLPVALHVDVAGGLVGALQRSFEVGGENLATLGEVEAATRVWQQSAVAATQAAPTLAPLVSLTLYLCSATAEVREARGSARQPARPQPTRTKKGMRLFPPPQPTTWEVAYRLGAALRRAQQLAVAPPAPDAAARAPAGQDDREEAAVPCQRPRAHIRRAHWHTYWVGAGSRTDPSRAQARVRWLPPIPVGLPDALIPTIRPVT